MSLWEAEEKAASALEKIDKRFERFP